jgi:hypothetical protein
MPVLASKRGRSSFRIVLFLLVSLTSSAAAGDSNARVYVVLWFDTEDYILPASDDAALHLASFLTQEKIRATFKVVGEKARVLERRRRNDVIEALKRHEIGYHSNFHSVEPTPALYLSNLGWDDGVAEFDRRERPGFDDVKRIFGVAPSCYGQPGSSWGPQSYGAMKKWGMQVYLDAGEHVRLRDQPCYYCGILNLYKLAYLMRADINNPHELEAAEQKFANARRQLLAEGGGVVSIMYHPCEFVHKQFWDGVNFNNGANPPPAQWRLPPMKSPDEARSCYQVFEDYIRFLKRFDDVRFITASEAGRLYRDHARGRNFSLPELRSLASNVKEDIGFQEHDDYALSASEIFLLLNRYVAERAAGHKPDGITLTDSPLGPSSWVAPATEELGTDSDQLLRTARDVDDFVRKQGRMPTSAWLGSLAVPPEMYMRTVADAALLLLDDKPLPDTARLKPARLRVADHVAEDGPQLWGWVIFPRGFRAPGLMEVARRQAWTLKPALLERQANDLTQGGQ